MNLKKQSVVSLSPEQALGRVQRTEVTAAGLLLGPSSEFYSPEDVDESQRVAWRLVGVQQHEGELTLAAPRSGGEHPIDLEDRVWLLAKAARTLQRLGVHGDVPCRLDLPLEESKSGWHISDVHGQPVDLAQPLALDEVRGLRAVRELGSPRTRIPEVVPETSMPCVVSEEEAFRILSGLRPGVELAVSNRGQWGAVGQTHTVGPFRPGLHLAIVRYAGGREHDKISLLVEIAAGTDAESLAWRLRSVAQRLIAIGVSASANCMISIDRGESLLNPCQRIRDHMGSPFEPMRMYRLSHVRRFRDVDDLPSLKRLPEERIFDAEAVVSGEYTLDQALSEAARCVECGLCRDICPSGVGLVSYVDKLKRGDVQTAAAELRELNPGVDMTCQVCPAPCQELCILAHEEIPRRPVNIRGIERVLSRQEVASSRDRPPSTGFRVALVGLGPANMVAAARLARNGHEVHIYEKQQEFGGAVSLIPSFRMRQTKVHEWVKELLEATGVKIHTGITLGQDLEFKHLHRQFDAVVLGIGSGKPLSLGIEGEGFHGVVDALQVLRSFNKAASGERVQNPPPKPRNTIIIGGGDVAADVVMWYIRTAAQCAKEVAEAVPGGVARQPEVVNVVWAYRRGRMDMPVSQEVLMDAEDEMNALKEYQARVGILPAEGELASGVYFHLRPLNVLGEAGRVCGIRFIRTRSTGKRDRVGRRIVEDIPGSEFTIPADSVVVLAIGQQPDPIALKSIPGVSLDKGGRVVVDDSMKAADKVYAVGDLVGGEILAEAISHGRRAAHSIHQGYLATCGKVA